MELHLCFPIRLPSCCDIHEPHGTFLLCRVRAVCSNSIRLWIGDTLTGEGRIGQAVPLCVTLCPFELPWGRSRFSAIKCRLRYNQPYHNLCDAERCICHSATEGDCVPKTGVASGWCVLPTILWLRENSLQFIKSLWFWEMCCGKVGSVVRKGSLFGLTLHMQFALWLAAWQIYTSVSESV